LLGRQGDELLLPVGGGGGEPGTDVLAGEIGTVAEDVAPGRVAALERSVVCERHGRKSAVLVDLRSLERMS
jgi:hypothetical protein